MILALRWIAPRVRALLGEKVAITLALSLFFGLGWWLIPRNLFVVPRALPLTGLDRAWPFVESWIYIYLSIGLFNVVAPYLTSTRAQLRRHGLGFAVVTGIAFACFALFPVALPAPAERASTLLYGLVLADTRLNNFPSLHAGYTVYGLLYWSEVLPEVPSPRAQWLLAATVTAWAALLILSVLFLKQHSLADLAAGSALGLCVFWVTFRRSPHHDAPVAYLAPPRESNS